MQPRAAGRGVRVDPSAGDGSSARSVATAVARDEPSRVVTDARARTLAGYWQDAWDPDGPLARLARDGRISRDTIAALTRDLEALEALNTLPSALRDQLRELLAYVLVHGERGPVAGWDGLRDPARYRAGASAPRERGWLAPEQRPDEAREDGPDDAAGERSDDAAEDGR